MRPVLPLKYRKEYKTGAIEDAKLPGIPSVLFEQWLSHALHSKADEPLAMNLATSTLKGKPSSRIVLLRGFTGKGLVFYTNYESRKGKEILENPFAAVTFFWPGLERQIRVEGKISKTSEEDSDRYFESRPPESRIGALISKQSSRIPSRAYLEKLFQDKKEAFSKQEIKRPDFWGGYILTPVLYEFWQGRPHRLNDRIQYTIKKGKWQRARLAP